MHLRTQPTGITFLSFDVFLSLTFCFGEGS